MTSTKNHYSPHHQMIYPISRPRIHAPSYSPSAGSRLSQNPFASIKGLLWCRFDLRISHGRTAISPLPLAKLSHHMKINRCICISPFDYLLLFLTQVKQKASKSAMSYSRSYG